MKKYNIWMTKCTGVYLIFSILYNLFGRIVPVKYVTPEKLDALVYIVLAGVGAVLILWEVALNNDWRKTKYGWLLYLFLIIMGISSILNVKYGWSNNAKTMVWTGIQFILCYSYCLKINKKEAFKQLSILIHVMSAIWIVPVVYSIYQFITLHNYYIEIWGKILRQGIMEKRLFGVFNDPNFAAIICVFLLIGMYFLINRTKNKYLKLLYVLNGSLQFLYIVLSGSRTVQIGLGFTIFAGVYLQLKNGLIKNVWKRGVKATIAVFLLMVFLLGTQKICEIVPVALVKAGVVEIQPGKNVLISKNKEKKSKNIDANKNLDINKILERDDVGKENISNNRFKIWDAYLKGMKNHLIFGMSPRNSVQVFVEENPKSYIAQTDYETHNGYLSLFVCTGLAGAVVMLVFLFKHSISILSFIWKSKTIDYEFLTVLLLIGNILVFAFFFTDLFFVNDVSAILFFLLLGSLNYWGEKRNEKNVVGDNTVL